MAAYDYLDYIFNAQSSSYEPSLRVCRDDRKSVEITEMYSSLINKLFIFNRNAHCKFCEWQISAILSPFPLPEEKPCLCSMLEISSLHLFYVFLCKLLVTMVIKKYTNKVSAQSFSQSLRSVLTTSALK